MPEPDASQRQIVYRGDVNNEKRVVNMVTVQVCPDLSEPPFWTTYN
jgi:hypothetical protein